MEWHGSFNDYVLVTTGGLLLIQLFYTFFFYARLAFHRDGVAGSEHEPISIVVAARNEEKNIRRLIQKIMTEQDHKNFELVVVNDQSWDSTEDVLRELKEEFPLLHVVNIQDDYDRRHGKKLAITLGIKGAKNDIVVFTDADCIPASSMWARKVASACKGNKELVLGVGLYKKRPGFLNRLIRYDACRTAVSYTSFALAGMPYMGVGRNMCYRKRLFFKHDGFKNHYQILSGDDDLFVNEASTRKNTDVVIDKDAFTYSEPKETWIDWWRQKRRHFSTGPRYKLKHKLLLSLQPLTLLLFLAGVVYLGFTGHWLIALIMFGIRFLIEQFISYRNLKKLDSLELLVLSPILEIVFLFIDPIVHISNVIVKPIEWS